MLTKYSFNFGNVNMLDDYGIWVTAYDILLPPLRQRKITIPYRDGSYDFGAENYDDRILRLKCDTRTGKTRAEMREISYVLSQKNRITMWDEPDKYYIGRIYSPQELLNLGEVVYKFNLELICEPFAYGETKNIKFINNEWQADYAGTANTPVRIEITNTGTTAISGIKIKLTSKKVVI